MEFFNGEKVIVAHDIKTESGEMIKCAEEVIITKIRPDLISVQWNKDKRELNALTPPDSIFKYTESNREVAENRKEFFEAIAMEKRADDLNNFLKLIKEYWDKNKNDVKLALKYIGKSIKNKIQNFTGEFDKLYNGIKGIIGVQYADTLAQYIPDLSVAKVGKTQQRIRTAVSETVFINEPDTFIPCEIAYDVILYKLSNLVGGLYPHEIVEKVVPAIPEYTDEQKTLILKLSRLADNYRIANMVLPLAFMDKEDYEKINSKEVTVAESCEIADKYDVRNKKLKTKQVVNEKEKRPSQLMPAKGAQPEFAELDRLNADPNSTSGHFF
jgi:hypothetical protein